MFILFSEDFMGDDDSFITLMLGVVFLLVLLFIVIRGFYIYLESLINNLAVADDGNCSEEELDKLKVIFNNSKVLMSSLRYNAFCLDFLIYVLASIAFAVIYHFFFVNVIFVIIIFFLFLIVLTNFILGDTVPRMLAQLGTQKILLRFTGLIFTVCYLGRPMAVFSRYITYKLAKVFGANPKRTIRHDLDENTTLILETENTEETYEEEREMISSVIDFRHTVAKKVMIQRVEMKCLPIDAGFNDVLSLVTETGHSRIPVYEGDIDHIKGIIHAKDMLRYCGDGEQQYFDINKMIREVMFVPETKEVDELLGEFRRNNIYMAIVTDEYGGTSGLITVEDLLEEIVGDINDEYDLVKTDDQKINENEFFFNGNKDIEEINEEFNLNLPESEEYSSIGGLVFFYLGDVPENGYTFDVNENITLKVEEINDGRIARIRLIKNDGVSESPQNEEKD